MVNADVVDMVAIIMRVIIISIVIIAEGGVGEDIISDTLKSTIDTLLVVSVGREDTWNEDDERGGIMSECKEVTAYGHLGPVPDCS